MKKNVVVLVLCFVFLFTFTFDLLFAVDVTVSPDGSVSSFQQAVDKVRKLKKGDQPIVVEFLSGIYPITEPVVFKPEDSGTETAPVIYRAGKNQHVVFHGGRKITGWTKNENGVWSTKIPEVAAGKFYFEQLYINGKWATRCREPNKLYYYTEEKVETEINPVTGKYEPMNRRAFIATLKDIEPLKSVPKEQLKDVSFTLYNSWETAKLRTLIIDFDKRIVMFTGQAGAELMRWEPRQRYHIENYKAALNQSGEWFLDRNGTLSYIPLPDEDPSKLEIIAPVANAFLKFDGEILKDKPERRIANIKFEGLKFRYSGFVLPPEGDRGGQSALSIPFAVQLDGCRNISFENCEWGNIGGSAVRFNQSCTDCKFVKNYVHDLGANGVYIGIGHQNNWQQLESTDRNIVENCIIRDGGKVALGGIPIWIGHGSYNKVLHNDVSEFFYTGISVGWQWGYQPTRSHHNQIEFNHIHHLGHWVLSDMGGVYTLGVSPETTVSNNVIHDIYAYSYGGWGLYTDEGSTNIVMENNLVYRVKTGTFHQHYGKENIIRNNILAYSLTDQLQRSRVEEHVSFTFENNIVLWDKGVLYGHPWTKDTMKQWGDDKVILRNNLFWNPNANTATIFPSGLDLKSWQEKTGNDKGSIVADPKFKDPQNGDFRLAEDSPAFKIGFKRFDYSKAGVYGDKNWIALATSYKHPDYPVAPEKLPPLPLRLNDNFETPRSTPILKGTIHDENKKLIRISTDNPFAGEKCLEIADSPDLQHSYNPHLDFAPNYAQGKIRNSFAIRVRKNSDVHIEWRERSNPYKIGLSIRINNGKLHAAGIEPLEFPVDQWVQFELSANAGEQAKGLWNLTLTFADGRKQEFKDIKPVHADWKILQWIVFCNISKTADDSSFFLDNLQLINEP
ncbi:MAG: right-handed parallel beta-helix repeat-containing protein [Planctomycetaceae bacterium]|jgi:hypothetical protein|nr:right-handed parallel beta-helix repeat-containing protein [Planctomycetaceae bacterium]